MCNKSTPNLLKDDHQENMVELVEEFLQFAKDLLARAVITKEQYDQLTHKKIQFLSDVMGDGYLSDMKEPVDKPSIFMERT